jgi:hypothetical protein
MSHLEWKLLTKKHASSTQGIPPGKVNAPGGHQKRTVASLQRHGSAA